MSQQRPLRGCDYHSESPIYSEAQGLYAAALLVLAIWYQNIYVLPKLEYNAIHPYTRQATAKSSKDKNFFFEPVQQVLLHQDHVRSCSDNAGSDSVILERTALCWRCTDLQ